LLGTFQGLRRLDVEDAVLLRKSSWPLSVSFQLSFPKPKTLALRQSGGLLLFGVIRPFWFIKLRYKGVLFPNQGENTRKNDEEKIETETEPRRTQVGDLISVFSTTVSVDYVHDLPQRFEVEVDNKSRLGRTLMVLLLLGVPLKGFCEKKRPI